MYATHLQNVELLSIFVERGASVKSEAHHGGIAPLFQAAWYGNEDVIYFFLSKGIDHCQSRIWTNSSSHGMHDPTRPGD